MLTRDVRIRRVSDFDYLKIGEEFAKIYREWAGGSGHNRFPKNLFNETISADAYIKFAIAEYLRALPQKADKSMMAALAEEIGFKKKGFYEMTT
jgi:hypothetical protein